MIYASERTPRRPSHYNVAGMDRVQHELRRPVVWLIPLVVLAVQLMGSVGPGTAQVPHASWTAELVRLSVAGCRAGHAAPAHVVPLRRAA